MTAPVPISSSVKDPEPKPLPDNATREERDRAAMAWLAWHHRQRFAAKPPRS